MFRDYFVTFTPLSFYGVGTCDEAFDADVAGRGVVVSLVVTAGITTLLAICAPVLDGIAGFGLKDDNPGCEGVLPTKANSWLFNEFSEGARNRSKMLRSVLNRVMIALADQQILTGIAILVSGYVRAANLDSPEIQTITDWRHRLTENHFYLIVYLACLSSSSHLAAIITLKRVIREHKRPGFVRLALVLVFACLLTTTICLAVPFGPPTFVHLSLMEDIEAKENQCKAWKGTYGTACDVQASEFLLVLFYIAAIIAVLYPYWIAIVNTFGNIHAKLKEFVSAVWHFDSKWLPMYWIHALFDGLQRAGPAHFWSLFRRSIKSWLEFLFLGSTGLAFCLQLIFFAVSMFYVLLQRIANKPTDDSNICDLSEGTTHWGFGQILPMLLLVVPLITAVVSYCEVYHENKEKVEQAPHSYEPVRTVEYV